MTIMAERPTVLVDMDGVMADFDGEVSRRLGDQIPGFILPDPSTDFYITKRLNDPEHVRVARGIQAAEGFFRNLRPIENALNGWEALKDLGYHPRICSSPLRSNLWCVADKLAWLDEHLGAQVAEEAVFDKDKSGYEGIALIDDRPIVAGAENASWQHILFTQPYNLHIDTEYRLNGWNDTALPILLARCATAQSRLQ
jgi:5'-nucleotidase